MNIFLKKLCSIIIALLFGYSLIVYFVLDVDGEQTQNSYKDKIPLQDSEDLSVDRPTFIIWTKWRSGSTFFGRLASSVNREETFYGYEPLHLFGIKELKEGDDETPDALKLLSDIINCRYDKHKEAVNYYAERRGLPFFRFNPMTADLCKNMQGCQNATFLNDICLKSKSLILKVLRLSLTQGNHFLENFSNLKIIYLIRDPRAVSMSRSKLGWCVKRDCYNAKIVCQDLENEIEAAKQLKKVFPDRFFYLRYEDIVLKKESVFPVLSNILGQNLTELQIASSRMKNTDPEKVAFDWRRLMDTSSLQTIQKYCKKVLNELDYELFDSETDLKSMEKSALKQNNTSGNVYIKFPN